MGKAPASSAVSARRAALVRMIRPPRLSPPRHQPFVYARRLADGRECLVHARAETASLAGTQKDGPLAEDVATLLETAGAGGVVEERLLWAVVAPGNRAAVALVEQLGPDFIDFNVHVLPLVAGGPSLFINEHGFSVSRANCLSLLFEQYLADEEAAMRAHGATEAEIATALASAGWAVAPDAVQWAPAVAILPGGQLAVQFQLDVIGTDGTAGGWLGEERFTGLWGGLGSSGPMTHLGWSSKSAGAVGPASGPPAVPMAGTLALAPGAMSGTQQRVAVGTPARVIGFAVRGIGKLRRMHRQAILAHGHLRA